MKTDVPTKRAHPGSQQHEPRQPQRRSDPRGLPSVDARITEVWRVRPAELRRTGHRRALHHVRPRRHRATWESRSRQATHGVIQFTPDVRDKRILKIEVEIRARARDEGRSSKQGDVAAGGGGWNVPEATATRCAASVNIPGAMKGFRDMCELYLNKLLHACE